MLSSTLSGLGAARALDLSLKAVLVTGARANSCDTESGRPVSGREKAQAVSTGQKGSDSVTVRAGDKNPRIQVSISWF